jgi:hypothetical protein
MQLKNTHLNFLHVFFDGWKNSANRPFSQYPTYHSVYTRGAREGQEREVSERVSACEVKEKEYVHRHNLFGFKHS